MIDIAYAVAMSHYNRWMNERLYALCAGLSDDERKRDAGAFFKSIHGTLNHLVWADSLWLARFRAEPLPDLGGPDAIVCEDFDELRTRRAELDREIGEFAARLDTSWLERPFRIWVVSRQEYAEQKAWIWVVQLFNHHTHHRGQVTTLLSQLGKDIGVTDVPKTPGIDQV